MPKYFDILDHPSNFIYRLMNDDDSTVLICEDNALENWRKIEDNVQLISIYRYILQNNHILFDVPFL